MKTGWTPWNISPNWQTKWQMSPHQTKSRPQVFADCEGRGTQLPWHVICTIVTLLLPWAQEKTEDPLEGKYMNANTHVPTYQAYTVWTHALGRQITFVQGHQTIMYRTMICRHVMIIRKYVKRHVAISILRVIWDLPIQNKPLIKVSYSFY